MDYTTTISKRRRHNKVEYLARLRYYDAESGARKEKSRSAPIISEAKRLLRDMEDEFESGGQTAMESDQMTFAELAKHCKETRYCEAQFDSEGRKIIGVRGKDTIDSHIKALEEYFGSDKLREIRVASLRAYRKHRLFCKNRSGKRLCVATVNRELSTMRAMLNEAMVNDWILVNPFKKVRPGELISVADERRRETILTTAEEKVLLAACTTHWRRHLRVLVIAALDTGARQGELLKLRWSDIAFDEGVIKNVTSYKGKTVQRREVPLTANIKTTYRGENLGPLPDAEVEVSVLKNIWGTSSSRVLIGPSASKNVFRSEASKYNIIHLATHGILDNASPMYSRLVMARAENDPNDDGLLEAREIMQLDLHADLVVLSACQIARCRFGAGEGVVGMSWAFFVAGVPTMVASQWKVDSASTAKLMIDFHRRLKDSTPTQNKATALQQAAMSLMKDPRYRHPYFWAGFVLIGKSL